MTADLTVPPWMNWTALVLAMLAGVGLVFSWLRRRAGRPKSDMPLTIQPALSEFGSSPPGTRATGLKLPKFMPPPGPLASPPNDPQTEQRAAFRRVGNAVLIMVADDDDHRQPLNAWVIDRSRHGIRLAAETELRLGAGYAVRPLQAPPATPWCAVEILHCAKTDGHWEVGCRFLQPPPVQILMLFG